MAAFAVTAKSTGFRPPAKLPSAPGSVVKFPGATKWRPPTAAEWEQLKIPKVGSPAAKVAAAKAAKALKGLVRPSLSPQAYVAQLLIEWLARRVIPAEFPGWENGTWWWSPADAGPEQSIEVGDYTLNGFSKGELWLGHDNGCLLINLDDGSNVGGYRYWGHYPNANPLPGGAPGTDWPAVVQPLPDVAPAPQPRHNPLPNLAPRPAQRWTPTRAVVFEVQVTPGGKEKLAVKRGQKRVRPEPRVTEGKRQLGGLVYHILDAFAGSATEAADVITILADASSYHKDSIILPPELRGGDSFRAKLYWLFVAGGIQQIDVDELALGLLANEAEDFVFGKLGQLSKSAAQHLNLTVGPAAGPAL